MLLSHSHQSRVLKLSWRCTCSETKIGDRVVVLGSLDCLGSWSFDKALILHTDSATFPIWRSDELDFVRKESNNLLSHLEYKFVICRANGKIEWEPFEGNRQVLLELPKSQWGVRCVLENIWGKEGHTLLTHQSLPPMMPLSPTKKNHTQRKPTNLSTPETPVLRGSKNGSPLRGFTACDNEDTPTHIAEDRSFTLSEKNSFDANSFLLTPKAPEPTTALQTTSAPLTSSARPHRPIYRESFILANSGPITARYREITTVGRGTWGEVKAVVDIATGAKRAAKKIPKYFVEDADRFRQEMEIMKCLDHPNIVRLFESFEDSKDIYLIMDFCAGGELFDRLVDLGTFDEALASRIMLQILQAVSYCHSRHVAHRDLKPENFLFLNKSAWSGLKLIDFGLATRFKEGEALRTKAGTPYYVSPQVLEGRYGNECDVWSAGVIMYILLCGYPPFNSITDKGIMEKVKSGDVTFPDSEWSKVSADAKEVIRNLLVKNPRKRWTADQALKHRWFRLSAQNASVPKFGFELLEKFRRFQGLSRLKKIALIIMAQNIDEEEIAGLRETFMALDTCGDGVLTIDEIKEGIRRSGYR